MKLAIYFDEYFTTSFAGTLVANVFRIGGPGLLGIVGVRGLEIL